MNKIIAATVLAATVAVPVAVAAPSQAANSACITRPEFTRIHHGMTLTQVGRVVGGKGHVAVSSGSFVIRDFRTCAAYHVSNVSFQHGRVSGKLYI